MLRRLIDKFVTSMQQEIMNLVRQLFKKRKVVKRLRLLVGKGVTSMKQRIMTIHRLSQLIIKQG